MTAETNAPGSKRFARAAHLLEIFRYEREKYKHSSRMILPAILLFFYLGFAYSMAPQYVLDSFSICSLVVFLLMLAMGVMYEDIIFPMIDQTVFIKTEEKGLLFGGRCLRVAYISLETAAVSAVYPFLCDLVNKKGLFMRPLTAADIISAFFLFWIIGISGGITGLFANRRIFHKRETALILSVLMGLIIVLKGAVGEKFAAVRLVTWVLPPVYDLSVNYCAEEYFHFSRLWIYFFWMAAYTVLETWIYIKIMVRKKFE